MEIHDLQKTKTLVEILQAEVKQTSTGQTRMQQFFTVLIPEFLQN